MESGAGQAGGQKDSFQFAVLLGLIFTLEIAAGVAGYVLRNEVRADMSRAGEQSGII